MRVHTIRSRALAVGAVASGFIVNRLGRAAAFSACGSALYGLALVGVDILVARRYGLGTQAAVYQVAYQLLSVMIAVLSGGAVLGALIPIVVRQGMGAGRAHAQKLLTGVCGFVALVQFIAVVGMMIAATPIVHLVAAGFSDDLRVETAEVLRWMAPLLIVHGVASVGTATLLAMRQVVIANLAPVLVPLVAILSYPLWDDSGARWIAWAYGAGLLLQATLLHGSLYRIDAAFLPPRWPSGSLVWEFGRGFGATAFAHAVLSTVLLINTAIAGSLSDAELSAFSYGSRLIMLALAFLTTLINTVALPYMSEIVSREKAATVWPRFRRLIQLAAVAGVALALPWLGMADWLVQYVFARGKFSAADAAAVAAVQRYFVLQAPFYLAGVVCWRALNACGEWRALIGASALALLVDAVAAATLAGDYGARGVAAAHSMSMVSWAVALWWATRARTRGNKPGGAA